MYRSNLATIRTWRQGPTYETTNVFLMSEIFRLAIQFLKNLVQNYVWLASHKETKNFCKIAKSVILTTIFKWET